MTGDRRCPACGEAVLPPRRRLCDGCRDERAAARAAKRGTAGRSTPDTLTAAMATGDRRIALEALRAHLAVILELPEVRCEQCGGRVPVVLPVAATARELRAVVDELAKITPPAESTVDELRRRRDARIRSAEV